MKINKPNRRKSQQAKLGFFWCVSCDRQLVTKGEKCKVCGHREQKRNKKYLVEE